MFPNEKFRFEMVVKGGRKTIMLYGTLDEDSSLHELTNLGKTMVFNFKHIAYINSCGTRSWVNFIKELGRCELAYEECSPAVVRQMNIVPSFVGHARILSVYVRYVGVECDHQQLLILDGQIFRAQPASLKTTIACHICKKGTLEIDGKPELYTRFFTTKPESLPKRGAA